MKPKVLLLSALLVLTGTDVLAIRAIRHNFFLTQPDGSRFEARLRGDEFMKILSTADGCSITLDEDGWYCYACYDDDGGKTSSGWHVGDDAVPAHIKAACRRIPFEKLGARAEAARMSCRPGKNILKPIRSVTKASGPMEKHGLIILAQFRDTSFTYSRDDFIRLINGRQEGGALDWFDSQFNGTVDFRFDVSEIVTVSRGMSYYGRNDRYGNDMNADAFIAEACRAAAESGTDFSLYDDDGDGDVDNIFVFFAGQDEAHGADENHLWSHHAVLPKGLVLNGKTISDYACGSELRRVYSSEGGFTAELSGIGTFCHEYSHTFGLPDMYDTDYTGSGGLANGLWRSTGLMDSGNFNDGGLTPPDYNAVERYLLGISEPMELHEGRITMEPVGVSGSYYIMEGGYDGECFLIECRGNTGRDRHIGGSGMLIYHIDRSSKSAGISDRHWKETVTAARRWEDNEVNCNPGHECIDLIEAVPDLPFSPENIGSVFFTGGSVPQLEFWSGELAPFRISDIEQDGDKVIFTATAENKVPGARIDRTDIFQDAAIIQWSSTDAEDGGTSYLSVGEDEPVSVEPYSPGQYSFTIENLSPGKTYGIKVFFMENGHPGKIIESEFSTATCEDDSYPYICLDGIVRNADGSFRPDTEIPLRLRNAVTARSVKWTFGKDEAVPGGNGYFLLRRSGELRAEITYPDGSSETISKQITVRQ